MTDKPGTTGAPARLVELAIQLAALLVTAIASISFVAFGGAVVLWSRFEAAQLPADQAVAVQAEADLVTVGAIALVLFVLGGLLAVLLLRLLDAEGRPTLRTRRGLLVVVALEILAAYLVEQWDDSEGRSCSAWPCSASSASGCSSSRPLAGSRSISPVRFRRSSGARAESSERR